MTWYYNGKEIKETELANAVYDIMNDDGFERYLNLNDDLNGNAGTVLRVNDYPAFRTALNDTIDSIVREIRLMCPQFPNKDYLGYGIKYVNDKEDE